MMWRARTGWLCAVYRPLRRFLMLLGQLALAGCAMLPSQEGRVDSHALTDTGNTVIGRATAAQEATHPGQSGFRPLPNGVDAIVARIALAEYAERSLDVQYYIWHDDLTGRQFAAALLRAADRGVRVRILIDDVGVSANDENLLALDTHEQIEIRLFNPIAARGMRTVGMLTDMQRVNRRMHNKSFIADNQIAILGGRNIGDEYFDAKADVAFGDLDVLTIGRSVNDVSTAFDQYWNASVTFPISALLGRKGDAKKLPPLREALKAYLADEADNPYVQMAANRLSAQIEKGEVEYYWGSAKLLFDDPEKITRDPDDVEGHLLTKMAKAGISGKRELFIISPYFVPGEKGEQWLTGLASAGVEVTILTNSLAATDVGAVHAGYKKYRQALVEAGIKLYELKPGANDIESGKRQKTKARGSRASLHAKTYIFDRKAVFIGSLNLDPRSVLLNTEIGLVCESGALAEDLLVALNKEIDLLAYRLVLKPDADGDTELVWLDRAADGTVQELTEEPEVSVWRRFGVWFMGLLPIESQL